LDRVKKDKPIFFQPSTIETIDYAFFRWLSEEMNLHSNTNKGWEKTPVVWVTGERSAQIKQQTENRDKEGALILPRITIERKNIDKDPAFKGGFQAHLEELNDYKGGVFPTFSVLNQEKTSEFANAQSARLNSGTGNSQVNFKTKKKHIPVYTTYFMPIPVYIKVMYEITLRTEYQQQMNELMQPLIVYSGQINSFTISHENHNFECFFENNFSHNNNISNMNQEERKYETTINFRVLGYLMGEADNEKYPYFTKRENAVKFEIGRERTILNEENNNSFGTRLRKL